MINVAYVNRHLSRMAVLAGVLGLSACAGQALTQTGFLTNYDQMRPQPNHTLDAIYVKPGFSAANYSKVIIEPVVWMPDKDAPKRSADTQAMLQATFHDDLAKKLASRFTVIEDPAPGQPTGPGVLRVRAAITNTRRALWWVNVPVQAAQIGLGGIGLFRPSAGGASEEMQVLDGQTREPVVQIGTYNNALPWNIVGSYVAYNHARRAFSLASDLLDEEITSGATTTATISPAEQPVAAIASGRETLAANANP